MPSKKTPSVAEIGDDGSVSNVPKNFDSDDATETAKASTKSTSSVNKTKYAKPPTRQTRILSIAKVKGKTGLFSITSINEHHERVHREVTQREAIAESKKSGVAIRYR